MRALLVFLSALVPLLERRVVAAERSAAATESVALLLSQLLQMDPAYQDYLASLDPSRAAHEESAAEVEAIGGADRDDLAIRLEAFREYWYAQHGAYLDDELLIQEYERAYAAAEVRVTGETEPGRLQ